MMFRLNNATADHIIGITKYPDLLPEKKTVSYLFVLEWDSNLA